MENARENQWLIIANPAAGNGKVQQRWNEIESLLHKFQFDFQVWFTEKAGHGIELTKKGIEYGFRKIIAVGGDGTGHEVINGILGQTICPSTAVLFSLLTVGTGNDWIKTHKIPRRFEKWLPLLKKEKTIFQDVGLIRYSRNNEMLQHYFYNVAGLAYDGFLGKVLSERSDKITNKFLYLISISKWLFKYRLRKVRIQFNDQKVEGYFYTINAGICRFSGGGMQFVPHAIPDDGKFALTIVKKIPKWLVLVLTPFYYNGKLNWLPFVDLYRTKKISIEALEKHPTFLEADGKYLGETPVELEIIERGLRIAIP